MAKYLDKDPEVYARERDGFLRDLKHFHETRGTPFRRAPKLSSQPIDLYLLYSLVTGRGGWIKVNYRNQWSELFEALEIPICVNASIALKQIYLRYLDRWEKVHYLGEEADRGSDDDEESRHKRWSARALHSVPLSYNYNQHCVTEATREYNNLSTNIYKKSDYDRLALSLISPLPNEQDFAINVCTLLSNDGKHTLKLEKHARILDYLLAHAGVFNHGSLRRLFMHCYISARKQAIHNFWRDALINEDYLDLTIEPNSNSTFSNCTMKNHLNNCPNTTAGTSCRSTNNSSSRKSNNCKDFNDNTRRTQVQQSDCVSETIKNNACSSSSSSLKLGASSGTLVSFRDSCQQERVLAVRDNDGDDDDDDDVTIFGPDYPDIEDCLLMIDGSDALEDVSDTPRERKRRKWERSETDRILFNLGRSLGTRDYMGQRVLQIATILRNLSFIEENIPTLSNNRSFLRFMLLCTASRWNQLQNLGLDMLGNVAGEILVRDINTDRLPAILLKLICDGLQTEDRHWCISALEVLNKLSQNAKNEDTLLRVLEPEVYKRVCSFLTIHDVMLLIYTLECLYSLSSLGERSCNLIVSNFGVVDTLVSLVTVEGKSYGPKACIGMKLVETVTGTVQQQQQTPTQQVLTSTISTPAVISINQQQLSANANVASTICATSPHTISAPTATPVSISGVTTGPNGSTFSSPVKATTLGAVVVTAMPVKSVGVSPMNQELLNVVTVAAVTSASPCPSTTLPATSSPHPLISKPAPSSKPSLSSLSTTTTTTTSSNPFAQQLSSVNASSPIITAQQLVQQQHAHQQAIQENEQFALTWLRTTYEPCAILGNARVDSQELYKHYINSCQKIGRRGVIAPLHFPRCVRSVFGGTVGPNPAKPPGSSDAQFYDGIKVRDKPLLKSQSTPSPNQSTQKNTQSSTTTTNKGGNKSTANSSNKANSKANNSTIASAANNKQSVFVASSSVVSSVSNNNNNQQLSPASPILKAQLSAPPKQQQQQQQQRDASNISPTNVISPPADKSQVKSHPHLSQALMSASSTSSSSNTSSTTTVNSVSASSTGSVVSTSKGTSTAMSAVESSSGQNQGSSSTSLIKSLLATKVNNNNVSVTNERMQATEPQVVSPQVAARQQQQRLLAQQNQLDDTNQPKKTQSISLKRSFPASNSRLNGARQLFPPNSTDPSTIQDTISSSTISSSSLVVQSPVSSLQHTTVSSSRREPPQPPPPPLAALGGGGFANNHSTLRRVDLLQQQQRALENEDSDSIGNNSMASSTGPAGIGCVSSTEDGENSLASFDGLINGIPSIDHDTIILNEDSDDSDGDDRGERSHVVIKKPLMLADLLEKKVEREPPIINGILSKELRIGDKGLQLVENHIDKVLGTMDSSDSSAVSGPIIDQVDGASDEPDAPNKFSKGKAKKRTSEEELSEAEPTKKMLLSQSRAGTTSRNRIAIRTSPPLIDNSSNSTDNEDLNSATVSTAAAKLFADMAADILEDENDDDDNEVIPAAPREPPINQQQVNSELVDSSTINASANQVVAPRQIQQSTTIPSLQTQPISQQQQQVIVQGNPSRQIIMAQAPSTVGTCSNLISAGGMMLAPGTQLKTQSGQTVIVQNMQNTQMQQHVRPQQVIMQQGPSSQILLAQTATNQLGQLGQMQLVATGQSGGQPTQYVIQTTGGTGAQNYVVAQPQTAVVHGQQQTVLVAQTGQQVGGQGGKTIIILQPTQVQQMQQQLQQVQQVQQHVQKVVMGPLGQQMVVTTPVTRSSTINTTQGTITLSAAPQPQTAPTIITTHQTILPQPTTIIQTIQAQTNNSAGNNIQLQKVVHQSQTIAANDSCSGSNVQVKSVVNKHTNVVSASITTTSTTAAVTAGAVLCKLAPVKKKAAPVKDALFICEWANCLVETVFKSANQVFMHVCEEHCKETVSGTEELLCEWDRCDNMKRKRFSLMTHIQDKHCNLEAMKASLTKRKQSAQSGKSEPIVQSSPSQQHPGYAPDAAFHAIKRHALEFVNPKELQQRNSTNGSLSVTSTTTITTTPAASGVVGAANNQTKVAPIAANAAAVILPRAMQASLTDQDDNEGPVTKSIRLTASLILRNLVIYSTNCRRLLKPYEPHLANVALSNVESSRTIAQVLYDMNDSHHHHISSSSSR